MRLSKSEVKLLLYVLERHLEYLRKYHKEEKALQSDIQRLIWKLKGQTRL